MVEEVRRADTVDDYGVDKLSIGFRGDLLSVEETQRVVDVLKVEPDPSQ